MVRVVETVGSSAKSWDAAVVDAVKIAQEDAPEPVAAEIVRLWADIASGGKIARYRATVKVAYRDVLIRPPAPRGRRATSV